MGCKMVTERPAVCAAAGGDALSVTSGARRPATENTRAEPSHDATGPTIRMSSNNYHDEANVRTCVLVEQDIVLG